MLYDILSVYHPSLIDGWILLNITVRLLTATLWLSKGCAQTNEEAEVVKDCSKIFTEVVHSCLSSKLIYIFFKLIIVLNLWLLFVSHLVVLGSFSFFSFPFMIFTRLFFPECRCCVAVWTPWGLIKTHHPYMHHPATHSCTDLSVYNYLLNTPLIATLLPHSYKPTVSFFFICFFGVTPGFPPLPFLRSLGLFRSSQVVSPLFLLKGHGNL